MENAANVRPPTLLQVPIESLRGPRARQLLETEMNMRIKTGATVVLSVEGDGEIGAGGMAFIFRLQSQVRRAGARLAMTNIGPELRAQLAKLRLLRLLEGGLASPGRPAPVKPLVA